MALGIWAHCGLGWAPSLAMGCLIFYRWLADHQRCLGGKDLCLSGIGGSSRR